MVYTGYARQKNLKPRQGKAFKIRAYHNYHEYHKYIYIRMEK